MRIDRRTTAMAIGVGLLAFAGRAFATSDGNYSPDEMGCKNTANAFGPGASHDPHASPDRCQAARLSAGTDNNPRIVRAGLDHEEPGPDGFNGGHIPHHGTVYVGSPGREIAVVHAGTGIQQTPVYGGQGPHSDDHDNPEAEVEKLEPQNADGIDTGVPKEAHVYFGGDDNLETGEHDGVPERGCAPDVPCPDPDSDNSDLANGPSDGGAIRVDVTPKDDPAANVDPDHPYTDPVPGLYAGLGACVDGICFTIATRERQVYNGGREGRVYLEDARDVTDYRDAGDSCNQENENNCVRRIHDEQQDFYAHPGLTVYEDPDPQDSSAMAPGPDRNTHVGTGGVVVGGNHVVDTD